MASLASFVRVLVYVAFAARCYSQLTIALQWVPAGSLDDFDPQLYFGASIFVIIAHLFLTFGGARASWFLVVTAVVSYFAEQFGVETGGVFGEYVYPEGKLGPMIGHVPMIVPFSWITVMSCALTITNAATNHGDTRVVASSALRKLFLSIVDASVCVMYDMGVDPVFVHNGYWTWLGKPETLTYFGVPLQNFLGWFVTAVLISLVLRFTLTPSVTDESDAAPPPATGFFAAIPILYYTFEAVYTAVGAVSPGDEPMPHAQRQALSLIVVFTALHWGVFALGQMATGGAAGAKLKIQ